MAQPGPTAAPRPRAGLPIPWVNLRHGIAADELTASNTAACGTFILEWGLLSRLTGAAAPASAGHAYALPPRMPPKRRAGRASRSARRRRAARQRSTVHASWALPAGALVCRVG